MDLEVEMLKSLQIENYKSISNLNIELGQLNILIGENGAGKSNFLESLAIISAADENKLDHEFLRSRGIRSANPVLHIAKFKESENVDKAIIRTSYTSSKNIIETEFSVSNTSYAELQSRTRIFYGPNCENELDISSPNEEFFDIWKNSSQELISLLDQHKELLDQQINFLQKGGDENEYDLLKQRIEGLKRDKIEIVRSKNGAYSHMVRRQFKLKEKINSSEYLLDFVIFSPENSSLRVLESEGQILPLGIKGEGLLKLLSVMKNEEFEKFEKILKIVEMFQWVEKIVVDTDENKIKIIDRFMGYEIDHRSANEGFLFVLFYAALFGSKFTPRNFAVDNIDASLNPKLCRVLIKELIKLAKENDKQAFVTTHNPAILDGLDLHDDNQRLFVVERKDEGDTTLRRVGLDDLPKPTRSGQTIKLSEAFMRGLLGGLPTNF